MNHAIVNPPIDRHKAADDVKDVYVTIDKETEAGISCLGRKGGGDWLALTHYNFLGQNMSAEITDTDLATMFIAPMDTPGVKLICRPSYELAAKPWARPIDYPLSSRFDENDAIYHLRQRLHPWENVLVHRDLDMLMKFYPQSGFFRLHVPGCIRMAVKLDFSAGPDLEGLALHRLQRDRWCQGANGRGCGLSQHDVGPGESMAAHATTWEEWPRAAERAIRLRLPGLRPEIYPKVLNHREQDPGEWSDLPAVLVEGFRQ